MNETRNHPFAAEATTEAAATDVFPTMRSSELTLAEALATATETRSLEIGAGVLGRIPDIFRRHFGNRPAVVVADANTHAAAGSSVLETFRGAGVDFWDPFLFPEKKVRADYETVTRLAESLKEHDAVPVAVGSGTINDLTKLASHLSGRSYMSVATAASMDGYTAFGASITRDGLKQTFHCPAPVAVVADLDVIRRAPPLMNAWGYADLLAKVTAGADWLLADALGEERIHSRAWAIVQGRLRTLISDPAGVRRGDPAAVQRLVEGLMLAGFAMQAAVSSRPASGAEHQFSHLWDMQRHTHGGAAPSHGLKVGMGTMAVTALYEQLPRLRLEDLDVEVCCRQWPDPPEWENRVRELHGDSEVAAGAIRETRAKSVGAAELRDQLELLKRIWPRLREELRTQLIPLADLRRLFEKAGVPTEPGMIGITRSRLRRSFAQAHTIRRRFTVLDLAVRASVLEVCLDRIFGAGGVWAPTFAEPSDDRFAGSPVSRDTR